MNHAVCSRASSEQHRGGLWSPLTNQQHFGDRWIGSPRLNRFGLHLVRILISDVLYVLRSLPFAWLMPMAWFRLQRDGILVLDHFFSPADFEALNVAYEESVGPHWLRHPLVRTGESGFGAPVANAGGFDRCDGDTVNRFIRIKSGSVIERLFSDSWRMRCLTLALFGLFNKPRKHHIYELIHGDEAVNHDVQRELHSDTFHHTFKLWYFIDDVGNSDGPPEYVAGSHRSSWARLRWEYAMSLKKSRPDCLDQGGSFRVGNDDLLAMGLRKPQPIKVKRNTLLILDTKGFHRRGQASVNKVRRGLYANFRPRAFSFLAY